jgi:hypothetical protein
MAIVPQIVIRKMAFFTLEPPVFAAVVPKTMRKIVVKPYSQYSCASIGLYTFVGIFSPTTILCIGSQQVIK